MTIPFNKQLFYFCYNCGYGELGIYDVELSFEQAFEKIKKYSIEAANYWVSSNDTYFEFGDSYMVSEVDFIEEDWVSPYSDV